MKDYRRLSICQPECVDSLGASQKNDAGNRKSLLDIGLSC